MRNLSYEFDLRENELEQGTHFYMNGFALRLVLKERQKATRKWPVVVVMFENKRNVVNRSQNNENGKMT